MNFGRDHYVPALKLKMGEKSALADLATDVKNHITPLFEIVALKDKEPTAHLVTAFKKLPEAVAGVARYFIDFEVIDDGASMASSAFELCTALNVPFTPVIGLTRPVALTAAALRANRREGLALRLTRSEFEAGWVTSLGDFLQSHTLSVGNTDLIVDLGSTESLISDGVSALGEQFLSAVPMLHQWRTVTVLASAFPLSMRHVERDSHDFVNREEWIAWRDSLRFLQPRTPTFGDWAIQHPVGVENFDVRIMQGSAAIRYAIDEQWLLIKGRGTRTVRPSIQMPRLASQLISGQHSPYFAGQSHCRGCELAIDAANGLKGAGDLSRWRRIGTTHHIKTTVEALQTLPWP